MKTLINISADKIAIFGFGDPVFLERNGVDMQIGKVLVALDRKYGFSSCLVINGPGGFTNLRVGSLALNLLKTLKNNQFSLYSLSKIELYQKAYQYAILPRYGVIYIWQKSNVWLWDFDQQVLQATIKKDQIWALLEEYGQIFLDEVYDLGYFAFPDLQVQSRFVEQGILLTFADNELLLNWEELCTDEVSQLEPNYMMNPNLG